MATSSPVFPSMGTAIAPATMITPSTLTATTFSSAFARTAHWLGSSSRFEFAMAQSTLPARAPSVASMR